MVNDPAVACLIVALLVHQGLYVARVGISFLHRCSVPVAVRVRASLWPWINALLLIASISLLQFVQQPIGSGLALIPIAAWSLIQSIRLSNHIFLAMLLLGGWAFLEGKSSGWSLACLALMYALASFYKLNLDFLFEPQSIPRVLAADLLRRSRVRLSAEWMPIPQVVFASELLLAVMIPWLGLSAPILTFCLLLHLAFAVIGHLHFSLVVLAAVLSATHATFPASSSDNLVCFAAGIAIAALLSATATPWAFKLRSFGRATNCVGGFAYGYLGMGAVLTGTGEARVSTPQWSAAILVGLSILVLVALGIRTEASFAMFSNLRPFSWSHLLLPEPTWRVRYYFVVPSDQFQSNSTRTPREIAELLLLPGVLYHQGVVASLLDIAKEESWEMVVISAKVDGSGFLSPRHVVTVHPRYIPILTPPFINRDPDVPYFG